MGPPCTNPSNDREEDLNPGPLDVGSSAQTTTCRPHYLHRVACEQALHTESLLEFFKFLFEIGCCLRHSGHDRSDIERQSKLIWIITRSLSKIYCLL